MVSKCLCLSRSLYTRRTGRVVGTSCQCREDTRRNVGEVTRAVCCSSRREDEEGDRVFQQGYDEQVEVL